MLEKIFLKAKSFADGCHQIIGEINSSAVENWRFAPVAIFSFFSCVLAGFFATTLAWPLIIFFGVFISLIASVMVINFSSNVRINWWIRFVLASMASLPILYFIPARLDDRLNKESPEPPKYQPATIADVKREARRETQRVVREGIAFPYAVPVIKYPNLDFYICNNSKEDSIAGVWAYATDLDREKKWKEKYGDKYQEYWSPMDPWARYPNDSTASTAILDPSDCPFWLTKYQIPPGVRERNYQIAFNTPNGRYIQLLNLFRVRSKWTCSWSITKEYSKVKFPGGKCP